MNITKELLMKHEKGTVLSVEAILEKIDHNTIRVTLMVDNEQAAQFGISNEAYAEIGLGIETALSKFYKIKE